MHSKWFKVITNVKFNVEVTDKQLKTLLLDFNGADIDTLFNLAFQFSETNKINHQSIQKAVYEIQKRKKI